jgi:hypothetical protein
VYVRDLAGKDRYIWLLEGSRQDAYTCTDIKHNPLHLPDKFLLRILAPSIDVVAKECPDVVEEQLGKPLWMQQDQRALKDGFDGRKESMSNCEAKVVQRANDGGYLHK